MPRRLRRSCRAAPESSLTSDTAAARPGPDTVARARDRGRLGMMEVHEPAAGPSEGRRQALAQRSRSSRCVPAVRRRGSLTGGSDAASESSLTRNSRPLAISVRGPSAPQADSDRAHDDSEARTRTRRHAERKPAPARAGDARLGPAAAGACRASRPGGLAPAPAACALLTPSACPHPRPGPSAGPSAGGRNAAGRRPPHTASAAEHPSA
jgi:hypothetical protein